MYIFLGPPGSGKSTQALLLKNKFDFYYISWGQISREIENGYGEYSEFRELVAFLHDKELNFPSGFIKDILRKEFLNKVFKEGNQNIILDGYPRRKEEVYELFDLVNELGVNLYCVIKFNIDSNTVKNRVKNRFYCNKCGKFYNNIIKPMNDRMCDTDGNKLIKRDDSDVEKRYDEYINDSVEVFKLLSSKSSFCFNVNANKDENFVFSDIIKKIFQDKDSYKSAKNSKIYFKASETLLHTSYGNYTIVAYQNKITYEVYLALVKGKLCNKRKVPLRIHSSCITGDIFKSLHCDCGQQLEMAMKYINKHECGVIIYLFQEGRGINIINKIEAYRIQQRGIDTVDANLKMGLPVDMRDYKVVEFILNDLKIKSVNILSNNPDKIDFLLSNGINVEDIVPICTKTNKYNKNYLTTKAVKLNHHFF